MDKIGKWVLKKHEQLLGKQRQRQIAAVVDSGKNIIRGWASEVEAQKTV